MKITMAQIFSGMLLLIRLWLPAIVFIGLCMGIFLAFDSVLLLIDQIAAPTWLNTLIGIAWLSLFILYIMLGVAFTYLSARLLRRSFGSKELRVQRRMAILSGLPFYALCLLFLMTTIAFFILFSDTVNPVTAYASAAGFLLLSLASCGYWLLVRFLLGRSSAIARQ